MSQKMLETIIARLRREAEHFRTDRYGRDDNYAYNLTTAAERDAEADMLAAWNTRPTPTAEGGEPVAWRYRNHGDMGWKVTPLDPTRWISRADVVEPLYAHPATTDERAGGECPEWVIAALNNADSLLDSLGYAHTDLRAARDFLAGKCLDCGFNPGLCDTHNPAVSEEMVSRFLGWKLPQDFYPDAGITFACPYTDPVKRELHWPIGTNLFTAPQARSMLEHVLATAPARGVVSSPVEGEE